MELLNTIRLALQDAARAERLMADERFRPQREADLRQVERNILLRRIA